MPNPLTIDMDEAVNVDQISGNGVKMYPGCRIYGDKTVITAGSKIGYEGPVTIENCQIGPGVELKGGYFKNAVFLKKASMGLGAHIREGCILEEQANGAHCVGLKQTILFPFVTLGSLINFCDCLMAGGTSRNDHSEVGSSYIHFNFTPDGDKTTASLIGEVPRGVMLNQPPIFLGGQGGIVGPVRLGYGNVVAAGTILRSDLLEDNRLIVGKPHRGAVIRFVPKSYPGLSRVVGNNLRYIANLLALEQWYIHVRRSFFNGQEFGELIYAGALDKLTLAKRERIKRLKAMAGNMPETTKRSESNGQPAPGKVEFRDKIQQVCELFTEDMAARKGIEHRDRFLNAFDSHKENNAGNYIHTVQSLPHAVSQEGTRWLDQIVDGLCHKAGELLPSLVLSRTGRGPRA
ncbi:MAG: UDP-N-acetylglucosamine pyrophosphorylase [Deltaproteobacteria bacterium]|nr:UDP-N-acetylglucosamine pyrophosphorylase [Deltaproteobacteria bacterium]